MAVVTWLTPLAEDELRTEMEQAVAAASLVIDPEVTRPGQIYACDPVEARIPARERVSVLVSWTTADRRECLIEVRSSESMIRRQNRCVSIAEAIRSSMPEAA